MSLAKGFIDLVFPMACAGCGNRLSAGRIPLCSFCAASIQRADSRHIYDQIERLAIPIPFLGITFALWMYDKAGSVQRIHHALKYQNRPQYGVEMGKLMGRPLASHFNAFIAPDLIVPVPLHAERLLDRGYNQSLMLARGIQIHTSIPIDTDKLHRSSATKKQTGLGQRDRWENVKSAFSCPSSLEGAHVLLVDDVVTTGATLLAAANSLFEAGASCVSLAALAFARP